MCERPLQTFFWFYDQNAPLQQSQQGEACLNFYFGRSGVRIVRANNYVGILADFRRFQAYLRTQIDFTINLASHFDWHVKGIGMMYGCVGFHLRNLIYCLLFRVIFGFRNRIEELERFFWFGHFCTLKGVNIMYGCIGLHHSTLSSSLLFIKKI